MNKLKLTGLAAGLMIALSLTGCGADNGSSTTGTGTNTGTGSSNTLTLSSTRTQLTGVLTTLGTTVQQNTPAGTPLDVGGFLIALSPTVDDLLLGPDATLSGLLTGVQTILTNPNATGFTTAAGQIQGGLNTLPASVASLAQNLPCAVATLAGQRGTVCTGTDPAAQLQSLIGLFTGSNNPFAGTPLAGLGTDGAPGTPAGGPTGTPLDALLAPLVTALGTPGGAAPAPLNGEIVDSLGLGLATVGDAIIDGYNSIPGNSQIPLAGEVVQTLGSVVADLGFTLNTLEAGTGVSAGSTLNNTLTNVSNLLTAPGGLLGTLATASGNAQLISAVNSGNAQLNNGIDTLTNTLNTTLLTQVDSAVLTPVLTALAPLSCALTLFGDCSGSTTTSAGLNDLVTTLTSALDVSMGSGAPTTNIITSLTSALTSTAGTNNNVITQLLTSITTLSTTSSNSGGTGLLNGLLGSLLG